MPPEPAHPPARKKLGRGRPLMFHPGDTAACFLIVADLGPAIRADGLTYGRNYSTLCQCGAKGEHTSHYLTKAAALKSTACVKCRNTVHGTKDVERTAAIVAEYRTSGSGIGTARKFGITRQRVYSILKREGVQVHSGPRGMTPVDDAA